MCVERRVVLTQLAAAAPAAPEGGSARSSRLSSPCQSPSVDLSHGPSLLLPPHPLLPLLPAQSLLDRAGQVGLLAQLLAVARRLACGPTCGLFLRRLWHTMDQRVVLHVDLGLLAMGHAGGHRDLA